MIDAVREVVAVHTAGSPVDPDRLWTNRSASQVAAELAESDVNVAANTVARILREELGLSRRQAVKSLCLGESPDRNAQFERIAELRAEYLAKGWPVLSIDTKKKELLGDFFRSGQAWTDGRATALDHDFPSAGTGKVIPYGVYDLAANEALVVLAEGADTGELAADAVRRWWMRLGKTRYWHASGLLVLADSGGSNGSRVRLFRERLCGVASRLNRDIRVAHLPPYCSKYNPIDHRVFCHLSRSLRAVLIRSVETIREAFARTTTAAGLRVVVEVARRKYQAGVKASDDFLRNDPIIRDPLMPTLNYTAPSVW